MKPFYTLHFLFILLFLSGCSERSAESRKRELTDNLGRKVLVVAKPERVMALSSSLTEMLYLICDEEQIVARTQNCDYPAQVLKKEIVSNYPIDYEKLLAVNPQLVFAKDGIISLDEAHKMESMGIPVYFQKYDQVNDIMNGLKELGEILHKEKRANYLVDSLKKELLHLKKSVAGKNRPRILLLISQEDLYVFGKNSYASDILVYAGAENAVNELFNNAFPKLSSEYILKINPDILIALNEKGVENGKLFHKYPELKRLDLYKEKKYYSFPEDLLSRPGPRVGETIAQLIKIIHPDVN